jgi:hypothetical protein
MYGAFEAARVALVAPDFLLSSGAGVAQSARKCLF